MSIDTLNKKLALLEEDIWEPGLPMQPGPFGQDDKQQLLWGYPGIPWGTLVVPVLVPSAYTLEYRTDQAVAWWTTNADPFWTSDAAPMWSALGPWLPWPGEVTNLLAQQYQFRLTVKPGLTVGRVTGLTVNIDLPDLTESLPNVAVSASGTRLPITKSYREITAVKLTVIEDGGTAAFSRVMDKDALAGPLVKTFNLSGVAVSGHVDADIQGY